VRADRSSCLSSLCLSFLLLGDMLLHHVEQCSGLKPSRQLGDLIGERTVSCVVSRKGFGFFAYGAHVTCLGEIVQRFHLVWLRQHELLTRIIHRRWSVLQRVLDPG